METILYTQEHFNIDMNNIISKIGDVKFDLIVGVTRGGCLPAVCLSHALGVPCTMIDYSTRDGANINPPSVSKFFSEMTQKYNSILIVDDLIDSGDSMKSLLWMSNSLLCKISVATLLHNTDVDLAVDHYWGTAYSRSTEKRYFDFWWEIYRNKLAK